MSVEVRQLSKKFGKKTVVNQLNFTLNQGEITGFLGVNGAGKSTTLRIIAGTFKPTSGQIYICGIDLLKTPLKAKERLGYLAEQNPLYPSMYVKEFLTFSANLYGLHKKVQHNINTVIEQVGLGPQAHQIIYKLSKGYKQRLGLAQTLLHNPDVLLLDEPLSGLDPNQLQTLADMIKQIGKEKTVLFSSHILPHVEAICDRVLIIHEGNIVADEQIKSLLNKQHSLDEYFKQLTSFSNKEEHAYRSSDAL